MILISIIQSILTNILKAIYEPFGFALCSRRFFHVLLPVCKSNELDESGENLVGNVSEIEDIPSSVFVVFLCGADAVPDTFK